MLHHSCSRLSNVTSLLKKCTSTMISNGTLYGNSSLLIRRHIRAPRYALTLSAVHDNITSASPLLLLAEYGRDKMTEQEVTSSFWDELTSPINLILVFFIVYLLYKIVKSHFETVEPAAPAPPPMPKLRKDLTVAELKKYDGTDSEGRVLIAVNSIIFDVTRGKRFYGPGGPYAAFAGKDATRGLATGMVAGSETEYDDVSDLSPDELASAKEWEDQFKEKYDIVGRLLKPGETPKNYSEEDSEDKKSQ